MISYRSRDGSPEATASRTGSASGFLHDALAAYEAADHILAERILAQVTEQCPDEAAAWHLRGLNAAADGAGDAAARFLIEAVRRDGDTPAYCASLASHLSAQAKDPDALVYWQHATDLQPENAAYRVELANCLSRQGRHRDALPHFEAAMDATPDDGRLLAAYGVALATAGDCERALPMLRKAHNADPANAQRAFHLGLALQRSGNPADAADAYGRALTADPTLAEARLNRSACRRELGDIDGALKDARAVLIARPRSAGALTTIGATLCDAGRHGDAIRHLADALRAEPDNVDALHNLGVALHGYGAAAEAEACLRRCLQIDTDMSDAQRSLANLYRSTGRLAEAAALYRAVTENRPLDFRSYVNLGLVLLNLNRPADAISVYEKAAALAPARPEPRLGLGIAQLATGDYENGFRNYEARLDLTDTPSWRPGHNLPLWTGSEAPGVTCTHPTVIVHAEQGFGDTIQFCRYLPALAASGTKIVFECPSPLVPLVRTLAYDGSGESVSIITANDPLPDADFHIPLLSLAPLFTRSEGEIPREIPYLAPPGEKRTRWKEFSSDDAPLVGLAWAGNPDRQDDRMRSCPAAALAPLLATPGVTFVSLQKETPPEGVSPIVDVSDRLDDFGDTAALIERLDLVVSVDTAVAHLAGALGKPVWTMLGFAADWRYLQDRTDCAWYPTMRLFRQPEPDDWDAVATRIAAEMQSRF